MRPFHAPYSFLPESTGSLNIGKDDLRWLEGFFENLNISRRATVPTPVNATDAATKGYVDGLFVPAIATIQEADLSPSITNPTTLRFDQADGFVLSEPSTGVARIDLDDVPYGAIQNVSATDRVLGRSTAGAGVIEEITCTAAGRALLDDATAAAQRTTLGSTTVGDAVYIAASAAAARTAIGAVIGTDVQAWDADLDAIAALGSTGIAVRTGAGAWAQRTITSTGSTVTITNAGGVAGNINLEVNGVPAGSILMIASGTCPTGYTEYTGARGRFIVGVPASGTLAGTAGSAMTNLQNLSVTPTFTGSALASHQHDGVTAVSATAGSQALRNTSNPFGSGTEVTNGFFGFDTDGVNETRNPALVSATSGGTPAGTVSAVASNSLAPYIQLMFCQKD